MPRVFLKTRNRGGEKTYKCDKCGKTIEPGQEYLTWKFNRGARYLRHATCGYPRRSELSNSKMVGVWDAVDAFDVSGATSADDIKSDLESVAQAAREVAQEYADSADNIEASWPAGNPTSEACRATSDELEAWADELESWEPDSESPDVDDFEGGEASDEYAEAYDSWLQECRDSAQDKVNEAPEYQG